MKTFKLSKKLLITSAVLVASFIATSFANAQDVSYASAGSGGATAYSANSGGSGYGLYSYPYYTNNYGIYSNDCCNGPCGTGYVLNNCDPCSTGASFLQSIPLISTLSNCGIGNSLGFRGLTYYANGFGNHFRFLRI